MATFTSITNILPDPTYRITDQGDLDVSGTRGPGFSGVNFTTNEDTQVSRTNSGRGVHRDQGVQYWSFSIKYNPMFREQFFPVDAFLSSRNSRRNPFFVQLPQYAKPRDVTFANYVASNSISVANNYKAGNSSILVTAPSDLAAFARPGDMISFNDSTNANHMKVYKVAFVETNARYQAGTTQPTTRQMKLRISPPLQRAVAAGSTVSFSPFFRVIAKSDVREYDLNEDNLYAFSLDVEEIQP